MKKKFGKNRLTSTLTILRKQNEKALVLFLTAGYPKLDSIVPLVLGLAQAGADIIELGMPFSDPLADGPIIQASSQQAIKNGITLDRILNQIKKIRKQTDIPLVLMGYLTPILHYGEEKFFANAAKAGVDGIILPEVPLEESNRFLSFNRKYNLADILFISPATSDERIQTIDTISSGFLYCVSTTGVTGRTDIGNIESYLKRVKHHTKKNPVLVGFGIKTPDDARRIARHADGVIVGSALIQKISRGNSSSLITDYVKALKKGMKTVDF
jgi:tryptophan synthase alpha chain